MVAAVAAPHAQDKQVAAVAAPHAQEKLSQNFPGEDRDWEWGFSDIFYGGLHLTTIRKP